MTGNESGIALECFGLGKRYRRSTPALSECGLRLPAGRICALVGPNGAGKSTLLALAAGMLAPTEGHVEVFGSRVGDPGTLGSVGFLDQDRPLFPHLSVAEHLRLGRELNPRWNRSVAEQAIGAIPLTARVATLSGGQRTRLALALVLGKQPDLLLLDEPMADLDPLARHEMTSVIMADAAERGSTVVISSHILAELESVCDHLVMLDSGHVRLAGEIDELVALHTVVTGACDDGTELPQELRWHTVIGARTAGRATTALIRPGALLPHGWVAATPTLEEVVLGYMRNPLAPPLLTEVDGLEVPDPNRETAVR